MSPSTVSRRLIALILLELACNRGAAPRAPAPPENPAARRDLAVAAPIPAGKATPTEPKPAVGPAVTDWYSCARQGAQLRAACRPKDRACSDEVAGKIVDCYRAVYGQRTDDAADSLEQLGPRFAFEQKNALPGKDGSVSFRQAGDARYVSPRRFAEEVCQHQLADLPRKPCVEEILFGVEHLVWMGGFGAGP